MEKAAEGQLGKGRADVETFPRLDSDILKAWIFVFVLIFQ